MAEVLLVSLTVDYLNIHNPELSATQIHDNVITTVSDRTDIVAGVMKDKLSGFVGVTPSLKIGNF